MFELVEKAEPTRIEKITEKVVAVICETIGASPTEVQLATTLDDLGADWLDDVEIVMALEEAFDVELPDEVWSGCKTAGDMIAVIDRVAPR